MFGFNLKKNSQNLEALTSANIKALNDVKTDDELYTNARIIKEVTGTGIKRPVFKNTIPTCSIARFDRKGISYLLGLDKNGNLFPIEPPNEIKKGHSPTIFYSYMETIPNLVERAVPFETNILTKVGYGLLAVCIIIELIFLFLIGSALMG